MHRTESDTIGSKQIPHNALYGIHSARAVENFPNNTPMHPEWYKALGLVKLACYNTVEHFKTAVSQRYPEKLDKLKLPDQDVLEKLKQSALEVNQGEYIGDFIVPALQGGAGTSINLNLNEIICNASLLKLNKKPGEYQYIHPIEDANIYQSTNDVVPTALKVATLFLLNSLEEEVNGLRGKIEKLESQHRDTLRVGYTQMQHAVPSSFGQLFGAYNEALGRDWWRVSKSFERIKEVNLGGGATGTGLSIPRFYIIEVVQELKRLSGLPITQSENLSENTSNLDAWVEIHAILKAHAVNLEKMVSDFRLLSSDLVGLPELGLPARQVGSSIMPGKINPVIVEYVIACSQKIKANDMLIGELSSQGTLELNANLPTIGHAILESIKLLISCNKSISTNIIDGLKVYKDNAAKNLWKSPAVSTALSPLIGYNKAGFLAKYMKENGCSIFEANESLRLIEQNKLEELMKPGFLMQKGFSMKDLDI